jgi:hypothetical protein
MFWKEINVAPLDVFFNQRDVEISAMPFDVFF